MTLTITNNYTTEQFTHTKTGEKLTLLKVLDKLSKDEYKALADLVKSVKGYYSKFVKGFLLPCDVVINSDNAKIQAQVEASKKQVETFNLFNATNIENIPTLTKDYINNLVASKTGNEYKNITAEVKKHLAKRFPMCKFSTSTRHYNSIRIDIVSSPFAKDSEELKAILNYAKKYLESYEYCTQYDPYGDYGSSYNFYGWVDIDYDYIQTETDVAEIQEQFTIDCAEHEKQKEIELEKEFVERQAQEEVERAESEKLQAIKNAQIQDIEDNARVEDLSEDKQYYVINAKYGAGKECNLQELLETQKEYINTQTTKVIKNVYLNEIDFENFCNSFMYDFSFIAGTGGRYTDDARINSQDDYSRMSEDERKTVEFINTDCVAVYCNNELKLVVDAQGYNYSRYVAIVDGCEVVTTYNTNKQEKAVTEHYKAIAEQLKDISFNIITENNIEDYTNSNDYKEKMLDKIKSLNIELTKEVIQQIQTREFKSVMYRILDIYNSVQYQFKNVELEKDTKLTLFKISDFGGVSTSKIKYQSHNNTTYAQYTDCIKLTCNVFKKRGLYSLTLKNCDNFIIVDGWQDLPDDVLNTVTNRGQFIVTESKYNSFDNAQIKDIENYFNEKNVKIIARVN